MNDIFSIMSFGVLIGFLLLFLIIGIGYEADPDLDHNAEKTRDGRPAIFSLLAMLVVVVWLAGAAMCK